MKPVLLVDCYVDDDYASQNFLPYFGAYDGQVCRASAGEAEGLRASEFSAIVLSGSSASVLESPSWVHAIAEMLRQAVDDDWRGEVRDVDWGCARRGRASARARRRCAKASASASISAIRAGRERTEDSAFHGWCGSAEEHLA